LVKDSTSFQIDPSLAEFYPGSGGSGSPASVRIQFEYDVLTGRIVDLSIGAFTEQDAKNSVATIELTQAGDLVIRDLAYMSMPVLQMIAQMGGFYLCRPNPIVKIYELKEDGYHKVDFVRELHRLKKYNLKQMEKEVYLGSEKKVKTRLILHGLPAAEVARRLRKARAENKKKGRGELTKEYKARAHFNLFITNASCEQLPAEDTCALYRIRWQIELIFKVWKSICHIAEVKKVKRYRLECYILSKLLLIVLGWHILWRTAIRLYQVEGKALSFLKAAKTLLGKKVMELREVFVLRKRNLETFLKSFYDLSSGHHVLEKKQKKPTSFELLMGFMETASQRMTIS
jgi:hypothetical protein